MDIRPYLPKGFHIYYSEFMYPLDCYIIEFDDERYIELALKEILMFIKGIADRHFEDLEYFAGYRDIGFMKQHAVVVFAENYNADIIRWDFMEDREHDQEFKEFDEYLKERYD